MSLATVLVWCTSHQDDCDQAHDGVDHLLAGVGDRSTGHQLLQLGEGDRRTGERERPDQDTEQHLERDVGRRVGGLDVHELGDRDQCRGTATHTIEDRHQLRHGGHLDEACGRHRDQSADEHAQQDEPDVVQ